MMTSKFVSSLTVIAAVALVACAPQRRAPEIKSGKTIDKAAPKADKNSLDASQNVPSVGGNVNQVDVRPDSAKDKEKLVESIGEVKTSVTAEDKALIVELIDKSNKPEENIKLTIPSEATKADLSKLEGLKSSAKPIVHVKCDEELGVATPTPVAECANLTIILNVGSQKQLTISRSLQVERKATLSTPGAKLVNNRQSEVLGAALIETITLKSRDTKDSSKMEVKQFTNIIVKATRMSGGIVTTSNDKNSKVPFSISIEGLPVSVDDQKIIYDLSDSLGGDFNFNDSIVEFHLKARREPVHSSRDNVDVVVKIDRTAKSAGYANVENIQEKIKAEQKGILDMIFGDTSVNLTPSEGQISKAYRQAEDAKGR